MATINKKAKAKKRKRYVPNYNDWFAKKLSEAGIKGWVREFNYYPGRKFAADFAWPEEKIILEIQGGVYNGGRHVRPVEYEKDCLKYSLAASVGWCVLLFTPKHLNNGEALLILQDALKDREVRIAV